MSNEKLKQIASIRVLNGMTQKEVAEKLGVTQQRISQIENGGNFDKNQAIQLAKIFNVKIEDIFLNNNTSKTCK